MAFDEGLADRVREVLASEERLAEKKMFGGFAFLLHGNLAVCVSGNELMVRVGREATQDALAHPHARPFDMTGRPMRGWVMVSAEGLEDEADLREWVARGVGFARTLPPKT
jgi:TfoX/Sxy family transcriptional regulator of competence genes